MIVDFGSLAAERERDRLQSIFIRSPGYRQLEDENRVIVLGNRGAGKTAALTMLAMTIEKLGGIVVEISPDDFAYEMLSETLRSELSGAWSKQGAFAAAWKYLLYVTAMKAIVNESKGLKRGAAKRIYSYLRDNQTLDLGPIGTLVSYLKRLESIKIGKLEASVKARELHRLYRLEEIDSLLDDIEELCEARSLVLVVDELDRGWDASENAVAFVAGLFQAGTSISVRTPSVRVVMSLRRELYENIPSLYDDAQKVRDTMVSIDWSRDDLLHLITRRIQDSLGLDANMSSESIWNLLMPAEIAGSPSFDHLLDLTLYRPRELIQICQQIQQVSLRRGELSPFSVLSAEEAKAVYARERFQDITAEYRFQYPGLSSVLETFRGCTASLTREMLELHCLRISLGELKVTQEASWVGDRDPDRIVEDLWRVGFLRCLSAGGEYAGIYQNQSLNIYNVNEFRIHDMFAIYLACVM